MEKLLRSYCVWCRWDGDNRFTLALKTPIAPELVWWLEKRYTIADVKPLPSRSVALLLRSNPKGNGLLLSLPAPKWGGSLHECNQVSWN